MRETPGGSFQKTAKDPFIDAAGICRREIEKANAALSRALRPDDFPLNLQADARILQFKAEPDFFSSRKSGHGLNARAARMQVADDSPISVVESHIGEGVYFVTV